MANALELLFRKKKPVVEVADEKERLKEAEIEVRPQYEGGYDESSNTIVRLVSSKKTDKVYKVTGIEDVASKNNWKAWLYLAPVIILIAVFLIYPLINTIFISFIKDYNYVKGTGNGFTLSNFAQILGFGDYNGVRETNFVEFAIPNTMVIVFVTVPLSTLIALMISVALNSIKWLQKTFQTIFFLPYVTNTIAVGMVFAVVFDASGVINYIFGLENMKWIYGAEHWTAMIPLCIYIIWSSLPFKILVLLSGLQGIDKQYYQAAQIDACSHTKTLWKITVPLLSPQILYILVTSFIGAFKEYSSIVGLFNGPGTTQGSKNMYTIVYYIYEKLNTQTSFAAAAAVFLFVIILVFTALQFAVSKKKVHY